MYLLGLCMKVNGMKIPLSSAKAHSQPDAKKYAPIATIAAAVAIPNVDDTCDALLKPDAEADAADPFSELDELDVVGVPEEDESSVEEDAVVADEKQVVVMLDACL
ncbi:hypothetical protein PRNP1_014476 [Phytophthora ramorum]